MIKQFFLVGIALIATTMSFAQANNSSAEEVASRIAQKMKDSLVLSNQQMTQLYYINMQISGWKSTVRQQYNGSDSLRYYLQTMENRRDSLYSSVLEEDKYLLYKQKKTTLISNN